MPLCIILIYYYYWTNHRPSPPIATPFSGLISANMVNSFVILPTVIHILSWLLQILSLKFKFRIYFPVRANPFIYLVFNLDKIKTSYYYQSMRILIKQCTNNDNMEKFDKRYVNEKTLLWLEISPYRKSIFSCYSIYWLWEKLIFYQCVPIPNNNGFSLASRKCYTWPWYIDKS